MFAGGVKLFAGGVKLFTAHVQRRTLAGIMQMCFGSGIRILTTRLGCIESILYFGRQ